MAAADRGAEAQLDTDFHLAIIEASHNIVLLHMMRSMYDLLQTGVFYNRQVIFELRTTRAALLDQHRAINTALQKRDPEGARTAVQAHLDFVRASLTDKLRAAENERIAKKRLDHEQHRQ